MANPESNKYLNDIVPALEENFNTVQKNNAGTMLTKIVIK